MPTDDNPVTLIQGDCLDVLRELPDGCVDAVVTDPPYGIGIMYGNRRDDVDVSFLPECRRVAKRTAVSCGIPNVWAYPQADWILGHFNLGAEACGPWGFACWMPILVYGKCPYISAGRGRRHDAFSFRPKTYQPPDHPCPKAPDLWRLIVIRTTLQGEIVLDPFMGSGTTGVACVQTGRRFIGIEIDPTYFRIAQKRINDALGVGTLFPPPAPAAADLFTEKDNELVMAR